MTNLKVKEGYEKAAGLLISSQKGEISRELSIKKQIDILRNLLGEDLERDDIRMISDDIETLKKVQG